MLAIFAFYTLFYSLFLVGEGDVSPSIIESVGLSLLHCV